jgi:hypothetical protein
MVHRYRRRARDARRRRWVLYVQTYGQVNDHCILLGRDPLPILNINKIRHFILLVFGAGKSNICSLSFHRQHAQTSYQ